MKRVVSLALVAVAAMLVADAAQAQAPAKDPWYKGIYIGAGAGGGRFESTLAKLGVQPDTTLLPPSDPDFEILDNYSYKDTAITSKFFAGYRILDWLAVEGGYVNFHDLDDRPCFVFASTGECSDTVGTIPTIPAERLWTVTVPLDGWTAYLVGIWPINDTFEAFGKAGAILWDAEVLGRERIVGGLVPCTPTPSNPSCGPGNPVPDPTNDTKYRKYDGTDVALGFGMNFNAPSGVTVRTEFEWFDIGIADETWLLSLSAIYNF